MTYRDFLNKLYDEVKAIRLQRNILFEEFNANKNKLQEVRNEESNLNKVTKGEVRRPEDIKKYLADLEKRYETVSLNKEAEKKLLSEIANLKKVIPSVDNYISMLAELPKTKLR